MGRGKPKTGTGGFGWHKLAENSSGFGALNLPESPVFYPTEDEFRDPLCFIEKIRAKAEPYGICRIVPPESWKPPFALDLHSFSFPTKFQAIHQLQERPATCDAETFELEYGRYLEKQGGRKLENRPVFQGQELDLCKLFNAVKRHGGFDKVAEEKKWGEVLRIIDPSAVSSAHFTSVLSQLYDKYLYDYEIYQMRPSSGKRVRKCKRGAKRAAGESISAPQGNSRAKRTRKLAQQSGGCNAEAAPPLKDPGRGSKSLKEEDSNVEKRVDQICEQCQSGLHEELMLLCDRCDRGWHIYCLSPPLETIPVGNWYCLDCLNCERESFGFSPGHPYSLDAFRRLADRFKRKWFGTTPTSHAEIERRFWDIVEGSAGVVEVMYGSDLDTSSYGSGFPRAHDTIPAGADPKIWQEYAVSPWNLNNFPKLQGSMLRLVHDNIAGVMVPWLYIGMLFSSFCWHFEDHCFYSINYLHCDIQLWLERMEECLSGKKSHSSAGRCCDQSINMLYDLKSEGSDIPILLPEMELLEKLIERVEMWQGRARELLKAPFKLQELEDLLQDADDFHVSIPELLLLRQHKCNALSWIERCRNVLHNIHERKDYTKSVEDLTSILTEGRTLRVQVEELDIVELELRKFLWREKASKALARRLPLKILEELINEVPMLQLPSEKLVDEISKTIEAGHSWEQSAKNVLHARACISEFEGVIRKSTEICAGLPSLSIIKAAVSAAESWLENAKPFLDQIFGVCDACHRAPLRVDVLQELIDESKLLKVSLKEPDLLRAALKNVEAWRSRAAMLLAHANLLLKSQYAWDAVCDGSWDRNNLMLKLEELIAGLRCTVSSGLALGFKFDELTKLKNVSAALTWNLKALSFSSKSPSIEDVESLISDARNLPIMPREYKLLESALLESKRWLMKACEVLPGLSQKKCSIQDLEELLVESQKLKISFPIKVRQIEEAVSNHRTWQKQVHLLCNCKTSGLTWSQLLQLKEVGQSSFVEEAELDMLNSRIADIGNWTVHCKAVVDHSASAAAPLQDLLVQIKNSLDRALHKFQMPNTHMDINDFCICNGHQSEEIQNVIHCVECKDRYHYSCLGLTQSLASASRQYVCPFCTAITSGTLCYEEIFPRVSKRNRPTLNGFIELLNEANGLRSWVYEIELVEHIVDRAKEWQSLLRATINHSLVQQDKNSGIDSGRLVIALKTIEIVEIEDQESSKLEAAVSINWWRNRARALLNGPTKPHFRDIRRVLKEGLSMNVAAKDYFLQELRRLERTASQWSTRAKQVVADHGALELDEVYKFIAEGERLPVDFSKELEALKVRSVLYCICRKPYDEDRAMIACDRCSEWYHFDCINLPEPDSSDEGCELLLQQECGPTGEFICPVCKPPLVQECSNLTPEMDDCDSEFTSEEASREGDGVATPFDFVRGKRRSRPTGKTRSNLQERLKGNFSSSPVERSKIPTKDKNQPENLLTPSGRPCRRTAGQHSKFESFVLLMHSR